MASSKTTRNHEEIRRWADARHAVPVEVSGTERNGETGILRFEFPEAPHRNDKNLKEISWDEFFQKFDENDLELLYQEETAEGALSNFNKLIHPESEKGKEHGDSKSSSHNKRHAA